MKKQKLITLTLALALTLTSSAFARKPTPAIAPAAKAILEEAITATGGREAMAKIKTRRLKGKMSMLAQGMEMQLTLTQKTPGKSYSKMEIPNVMTVEQGYDGEKGWSKDSIQGSRELQGAELDQAKETSALFPELVIMDQLLSAAILPDVEEDGKTLKVIQVTSKDAPAKTLYFDSETKLLSKMTSKFVTGPDAAMEITVSSSDYQEKDGVKFPSSSTMTVMGQEMKITFSEVEHNIEVDDEIFKMKK